MNKMYLAVLSVLVVIGFVLLVSQKDEPEDDTITCTDDAMLCPDGSWVGRTGPNCEFVCPEPPKIPLDIQAHIDSKADLVSLASPLPNAVIASPLTISGEARGYWFFEADFPVALTDWNGDIIAEVPAVAGSEWMSEAFVPFMATMEFESPYTAGDPDFMKNGFLILQKDNPTGLPEHDDALEIPVRFAP